MRYRVHGERPLEQRGKQPDPTSMPPPPARFIRQQNHFEAFPSGESSVRISHPSGLRRQINSISTCFMQQRLQGCKTLLGCRSNLQVP